MLWRSVASMVREDRRMHGAGCIASTGELIAEQGMEHMVRQRDGSKVKLSSVRDAIMTLRERTEADEVLDVVAVSGIDAEGRINQLL